MSNNRNSAPASDYHFVSPQKKILTPFIPLESFVKSQQKTIDMPPHIQAKVREFMAKYPGPITVTYDQKTRKWDIERAKL